MAGKIEPPLRVGDMVAIDVRGESKIVRVTSVKRAKEYWRLGFDGYKRDREYSYEGATSILVARSEDIESNIILELRVRETMLISQLALVSFHSTHLNQMIVAQKELQRTLFTVQHALSLRGARVAGENEEPLDADV